MKILPATRSIEYAAWLAIFILAVGPYVLFAVEFRQFCFAAQLYGDMNMYTLFADLHLWTRGTKGFVDPWYHVQAPLSGFNHLKFYFGFFLFGLLLYLFKCPLAAMLIWMAVVTTALFLSVRQLLLQACPRGRGNGIAALLAAGAFLLSPPQIPLVALNWYRLAALDLESIGGLGLIYGRFLYPQLPAVFLTLNFLVFLHLLNNGARTVLSVIAMVLLQLAAVACFPFAAILIGVTEFAILVWLGLSRVLPRRTVMTILFYGALSAIADLLYLALVGRPQAGAGRSWIHFEPSLTRLAQLFGGTVILSFVGAAVCGSIFYYVRKTRGEFRYVFAVVSAFSLSVGLMMLIDGVFAAIGEATTHFAYFSSLSLMLAGAVVFLAIYERLADVWRAAFRLAVLVGVAVQTVVVGISIYNLQSNANRQFAFIDSLQKFDFKKGDWALVPSDYGGDVGSWAPLVTRNELLYSAAAFRILQAVPAAMEEHRRRYALYAFFRKRESWTNEDLFALNLKTLDGRPAVGPSEFAAQQNEVAAHDPRYQAVLAQAKRIVVFEPSARRQFDEGRLSVYLKKDYERISNAMRVSVYEPRLE